MKIDRTPPTREQIMATIGNASFGSADPVELVKLGLLKHASGYATGHTVMCMLKELGLLKKTGVASATCKLTRRGQYVLYEWFARPSTGVVELLRQWPDWGYANKDKVWADPELVYKTRAVLKQANKEG